MPATAGQWQWEETAPCRTPQHTRVVPTSGPGWLYPAAQESKESPRALLAISFA